MNERGIPPRADSEFKHLPTRLLPGGLYKSRTPGTPGGAQTARRIADICSIAAA